MIAAIYARKSTEQNGVADDQKSVTRQIEHARHYAERKGWIVADDAIFVDAGISGAEFSNRPGFVRLMTALKPRPPFQTLIMSEESRLGREAIETAYALKQLVTAGVRVFFYLEDRERTLDSPTDKIMLSLTAFADELEREKARQRTYDAMVRKAKAGHVTGGRVFGYDNVDVLGQDGKRSHVERRINPREAAIVVRIFDMAGNGRGLTTIAKTLNAEGACAPRAQRGRPTAWAPSSVREILHRDLYRGLITWNRSRKRNLWGQVQQKSRPEADWFTVPAAQLRVVSDECWQAVHERLTAARQHYLRGTKGQLWGRPSRGVESKYLLPGLARCGTCGGSMYVKSRSHGKKRMYLYGCTSFHLRGASVCTNSLEVRMDRSDLAVLDAIEQDVLQPDIVVTTIRKALERLKPHTEAAQGTRDGLDKRLTTVERELSRFATAIAAGAELETLIVALKQREAERDRLRREIAALDRAGKAAQLDPKRVERELRAKLTEWRSLLRRHIPQARQVLKKLLAGPLVFTPHREDGQRWYEFRAPIAVGRIISGLACANMVASPTRSDTYGDGRWDRPSRVTRQAILKWASAAGASGNALFGDQPSRRTSGFAKRQSRPDRTVSATSVLRRRANTEVPGEIWIQRRWVAALNWCERHRVGTRYAGAHPLARSHQSPSQREVVLTHFKAWKLRIQFPDMQIKTLGDRSLPYAVDFKRCPVA
jgi:DNA invertase Pin-like site-specific DNA recombinase